MNVLPYFLTVKGGSGFFPSPKSTLLLTKKNGIALRQTSPLGIRTCSIGLTLSTPFAGSMWIQTHFRLAKKHRIKNDKNLKMNAKFFLYSWIVGDVPEEPFEYGVFGFCATDGMDPTKRPYKRIPVELPLQAAGNRRRSWTSILRATINLKKTLSGSQERGSRETALCRVAAHSTPR